MTLPFWPYIDDIILGILCTAGLLWELGVWLGEVFYDHCERRWRRQALLRLEQQGNKHDSDSPIV